MSVIYATQQSTFHHNGGVLKNKVLHIKIRVVVVSAQINRQCSLRQGNQGKTQKLLFLSMKIMLGGMCALAVFIRVGWV